MIPLNVVHYHAVKTGISEEKSSKLFNNLELFLAGVLNDQCKIPTIEVDDAWHTFILHTKLYQKYCEENFNGFIHHNPHPPFLNSDCDAGGQMDTLTGRLAACDKEDETHCDGFLQINNLSHCDGVGGGVGGGERCDSQFTPNNKVLLA